MNSLFNIIISAFKTKVMPIWNKIRLWTSPAYLRTKGLSRIRTFFLDLFNIKPKNRKDYYTVFFWMIGKKLAFCLVVLLGTASLGLLVLLMPNSAGGTDGRDGVRTYRYDSLPLKFQKGQVRILAKDGHTAYVGAVKNGTVTGNGKLYGTGGKLIYDGAFDNNRYHGQGRLFYDSGGPRYMGEFTDNLFQGTGTGYWENGNKEYTGGYAGGLKSGEGVLYNSSGSPVFNGTFSADQIVYSQLVGKTTQEVGKIYTGVSSVYTGASELCVMMSEIGAVYSARDGSKALDQNWKVEKVYVLQDSLKLGGQIYDSISRMKETMGEPVYQGYFNMELSEAVGITGLMAMGHTEFADPQLRSSSQFDQVMEVSGYHQNYDLYLQVFEYEGLVYGFYSDKQGDKFAMYSMEAKAAN